MKTNNKQTLLKTILLVLILIATIFSYSNILGNDFQLIWGDNTFLLNKKIMEFSFNNILGYFGSYIDGTYQPLSSIFFSINYQLFGLNAEAYHIENLLFHLVNIILVFILMQKVTGRLEIAVIVALFFGIHPMHVESVAWITGFRDLLFSLFFLSSLIVYTKYIAGEYKRKHYYLSLILFLLSLFSKSMAVTLPIVLLLIDYFRGRAISKKLFIEKIPFFMLSIIFGIVAILANQSSEGIDMMKEYAIGDRFFLISYTVFAYMVMLVYPVKGFAQSAIHYYPEKINGLLPTEYYLAPAVILVIFLIILFLRKYRKPLLFGFLFFLATISVVTQIIPFGHSIISERHTYIPYIGLFFILAFIYDEVANKSTLRRVAKPALIIIFLAMGVFFSFKTWHRNRVWNNSITLFGNVARRYPAEAEPMFLKGLARHKANDIRGAVLDYNAARYIDPYFMKTYYWRGIGRFELGLPEPALADFDIVIQLDSSYYDAYIQKSKIKIQTADYKGAINDCLQALNLKENNPEAYKYLGIAKHKYGKNREALDDLDRAIELNPEMGEAYFYRGLVKQQLQGNENACPDWEKAESLGFERATHLLQEHCN